MSNNPTSTFEKLIFPYSISTFFNEYWEQKPLFIPDQHSSFSDIYSYNDLLTTVQSNKLYYTQNINVCRCIDNKKEMLETEPNEVSFFEIEQYFKKHNATFQVLQPQQHSESICEILSDLEEYFGCLVGSNVYITPKSSKGLAPHYDDVEVFIIQLEGKKRWQLHTPIDELADSCSGDLSLDEIGEPVLDIELNKGDMLYFPRGWIHHATTSDMCHSSHITISTYQKHSYGDVLSLSLMNLSKHIKNNSMCKHGLPLRVLSEDSQSPTNVYNSLQGLLMNISSNLESAIDTSFDMIGVDFFTSRLPPTQDRINLALGKDKKMISYKNGHYGVNPSQSDNYYVRLLDPGFILMVKNEDDYDEESSEESSEELNNENNISNDNMEDCDNSSDNDKECPNLVNIDENEDNNNEVGIYYYTKNRKDIHMGPNRNSNIIICPEAVEAVVYILKDYYPKTIKIKHIQKVIKQEMKEDIEINIIKGLLESLWENGLLVVIDKSSSLGKRKRDKSFKTSPSHKKSKK